MPRSVPPWDDRICLLDWIAGRRRNSGTGNARAVERFTDGLPTHAAHHRSGPRPVVCTGSRPRPAGRGCGARTAWCGRPWSAGWSCCPRGLRRGRCARPSGQRRGPAGLPATRAGGRLVSTTIVLVASRRRRGRRRGTRVRDGRGRYSLRYLATACCRLLLVLQQSATHPRLLGCLSPVRAEGCQCLVHREVSTNPSTALHPPGGEQGGRSEAPSG
jgi:hypothetical protein